MCVTFHNTGTCGRYTENIPTIFLKLFSGLQAHILSLQLLTFPCFRFYITASTHFLIGRPLLFLSVTFFLAIDLTVASFLILSKISWPLQFTNYQFVREFLQFLICSSFSSLFSPKIIRNIFISQTSSSLFTFHSHIIQLALKPFCISLSYTVMIIVLILKFYSASRPYHCLYLSHSSPQFCYVLVLIRKYITFVQF